MCGIAGCYQQPEGAQLAAAMSDALAHRGPDALGQRRIRSDVVEADIAHRRLSIIDLTCAADQPFSKGGLVLTYNGELFNYRELRQELVAHGANFRTSSDTEVVLEAWRLWGPASLARLRGMFAFAILDEGTGHLALVRDPLGIKPLFYLRRGAGLLFASELKAIAAAVGDELRIDQGAMVASMLYYWIPEQRCAYQGVVKLPPGVWADVSPDGELQLHRYFSVEQVAADAAIGPAMDLREVIEDSVRAHLVADVPVATFLSGGLDSSIITVLARRLNPDLAAYTIKFRSRDQRLEAMPDDSLFARKVAELYDVRLHEIELAPDVVDMLPRIARILDEPIGDPAAINTFLICEAARESGAKVLLSGMGADELFGGYRKHLACTMAARYQRLPTKLRTHVIAPASARLPVAVGSRGLRTVRWGKRFLSFAELEEEPAFLRSYTLYGAEELSGLIDPQASAQVGAITDEHAAIYHDNALSDHASRMCLADVRMFLPSLNLAYTDRASMAASTEVRVPFVDVEVLRAAFSLPGREKVGRRTGKVALKEAAATWLPSEIIHRPKAAFGAPLRAWISRDLREMVDDVLLDGDLVSSGFLRRPAVERLVADDRAGREDRSKQIWQLLTLELWHQQARATGAAA